MKKSVILLPAAILLLAVIAVSAQENLQKGAVASDAQKTFTTVKEIPITSVKNQFRSGTCWDYGTLGYFESEILRKTGRTYDFCENLITGNDTQNNYDRNNQPQLGEEFHYLTKKSSNYIPATGNNKGLRLGLLAGWVSQLLQAFAMYSEIRPNVTKTSEIA